ncbi:MAG: hypothetical protein L0Y58_25260 [Verrucomicrobia subdivision 3 bacterium]|nr:hypothetical protein [Limisphaerales bacterium]
MRTKTLLLTAALSAAGVATSMAQVYSVNMVGYINCQVPTGFSMLANQLNASPDNKITTILPAPPNNTQIFKFNPATGGYIFLQFVDGAYEGDDLDLAVNPGEGVFISAGTAFTATFVGEVQLSSSVSLPAGFSVAASALPQSLPLTPAPPAGLDFPVGNGDQIFQFNPATGGYIFNQFVDGAWEGDGMGAAPTPAICEPFFVNNAGAAKSWNRTFSVGP